MIFGRRNTVDVCINLNGTKPVVCPVAMVTFWNVIFVAPASMDNDRHVTVT